MTAPLLVFAVGNPSRGDDALGPLLVERLERAWAPRIAAGEVELLVEFQLQVEHALDLSNRRRVVFVDADLRGPPPFLLDRVLPVRDVSFTTHALTPAALLHVYCHFAANPPEAWLLAIRGESFELGDGLSDPARIHLEAALECLLRFDFDAPRPAP